MSRTSAPAKSWKCCNCFHQVKNPSLRLLSLPALLLAPLAVVAQAAPQRVSKEFINPPTLPKSAPGYSQAVAVRGGRTLYVAGQVGANAQGELVGTDLRTQLTQAFQNLSAALKAAGATPADVVKVSYYVVNYSPDQLGLIREVRDQFFPSANRPASTLVGVAALYQAGVLVEIEAVAVTQ